MCYTYGNEEKEYVFCVKGRPFPCLVSPYLPTPTASLLDYDLVRSLGLKMTDLQCQKFSYAGYKMRILGKISTSVQCIHDVFTCRFKPRQEFGYGVCCWNQDGHPAPRRKGVSVPSY